MRLFSLVPVFSACFFAFVSGYQPPVRQFVTFPDFAENLAIRSNGHVLVTSLTTPSIYYVDPLHPSNKTILPPIPGSSGISGITELNHDLFVVAPGVWNVTARRGSSFAIWTIDFRAASDPLRPKFTKLFDVKGSNSLNGLTNIPGTSIVLASDSVQGLVYRLEIEKRTYSIAIKDPAFAPLDEPSSLGINGIRTHESHLYFCNSAIGLFGRVPISRTGSAIGPVQRPGSLFNSTTDGIIDDFAVDSKGNAWIADHPHSLVKVDPWGRRSVVTSGEGVPDPTSAVFGRGSRRHEELLFVSTNVLSEQIVGGVAIVDTKDL